MPSMLPERRTDLVTVGLLVVATVIALVWANSPWFAGYESLIHLGSGVDTGFTHLHLDPLSVVDDGLMAVFFLQIGLEIKRELVIGELREPRVAMLPAVAAIGGMVVPATLYAVINAGAPGVGGWGVPLATDIAFALGVIALLGPRIPSPVRLFLLTLAVVDDIGAIIVIAIWYSGTVQMAWLAGAGALAVVIGVAHRRGHHAVWLHVVLGVALWYCTYRSGIHATIAGVVAGLLATAGGPRPVAERWEHALAPVVGFVIVPLFAFVNAGVRITSSVLDGRGPVLVAVGTVAGLVVGKFVGVVGASWLAVRLTSFELPAGVTWRHLCGIGGLAGMGFTVSLFVANLAFDDPALESAAKVGVLVATAIAAVSGALVLGTVDARARTRRTGQDLR